MAKLLIDRDWYAPLASSAYYEFEYASLIKQHSSLLFPDYEMVPFNTSVKSEYGSKQPDFALIERQYRCWWIVEIELAHHAVNHVVDQVAVFSSGNYGESHASYLKRMQPDLDRSRLSKMMKGQPPGVVVIVDTPKPYWEPELRTWGARLAVVQIFRSTRNHHVLLVDGSLPTSNPDVLSLCRLDSSMPRLVLLESPANVPIPANGKLVVEYAGTMTEWECIQTKDRVWLSPVRTNPLPKGMKFALVRGEGNNLILKPVGR